jgi:hypothetical protein
LTRNPFARQRKMTLIQITSGYFCAGLLVDGKGRVARAAPILGWTIGKDWMDMARYAQIIDWSLGTIIVTGSKARDFYDLFCNHRATLLKADGKDILSVELIPRADDQCEGDGAAC